MIDWLIKMRSVIRLSFPGNIKNAEEINERMKFQKETSKIK